MADLLAIAASNGENLRLAERFAARARERTVQAEVLDLTAVALPLFSPRVQDSPPEALPALAEQLAATPRWVLCAPEYNGSIRRCSPAPSPGSRCRPRTSAPSSTAGRS